MPRGKAPVLARIAVALLLAVLVAPIGAFAQSYSSSQQSAQVNLDDRALAVANQLECPVCQNVTVAYSNSELAGQMRQVIREKLAQGETDQQIIQYFVARYGEGILTQPPKQGLNLVVWLLPAAGLLVGLGVLFGTLRPRSRPAVPEGPGESEEPLNEADEQLLSQALKGAGTGLE